MNGLNGTNGGYSKALATAVAAIFITAMAFPTGQVFSQGLREVSGTYVNSEFDVEIVLPEGVTGTEVPSDYAGQIWAYQVLVDFSESGGSESTMQLSMQDRAKGPPDPGGLVGDPLEDIDPSGQRGCVTVSTDAVTVASRTAQSIVVECPEPEYSKAKIYAIDLGNQKWVSLMYLAVSASDYDQDIGKFESSVDTLKLSGVGVDVGIDLELTSSLHSVVLADTTVQVEIQSTSEISDFQFDAETKKISFKATGDDGTQGTAIIAVSKALKGPYTVSVDGQLVTNFETIETEATGETSIKLTYSHSTKDVSITGAEVVPEFSAIAALILAVMLLTVMGFGVVTRKFGKGGISSLFGGTR